MSQAPTPSLPSRIFSLLILAAAIAVIGYSLTRFMSYQAAVSHRAPRGGLGPGAQLPTIKAEGWLNGEAPTPESLKGKVVVIDAWAHWCEPCRLEAPHLVQAYNEFHPRGVVFIGLSSDAAKDEPQMKQFLSATKIVWPCGYGADDAMIALQTTMIPQVWVVGTNGRIRWNLDSPGSLDDAIEEALATGATR